MFGWQFREVIWCFPYTQQFKGRKEKELPLVYIFVKNVNFTYLCRIVLDVVKCSQMRKSNPNPIVFSVIMYWYRCFYRYLHNKHRTGDNCLQTSVSKRTPLQEEMQARKRGGCDNRAYKSSKQDLQSGPFSPRNGDLLQTGWSCGNCTCPSFLWNINFHILSLSGGFVFLYILMCQFWLNQKT